MTEDEKLKLAIQTQLHAHWINGYRKGIKVLCELLLLEIDKGTSTESLIEAMRVSLHVQDKLNPLNVPVGQEIKDEERHI